MRVMHMCRQAKESFKKRPSTSGVPSVILFLIPHFLNTFFLIPTMNFSSVLKSAVPHACSAADFEKVV